MARLQTRRTVSRGNTPQSPPRQIPQSSTSPRTRRLAQPTSRVIRSSSRVNPGRDNQVLAAVEEQDDAGESVEDELARASSRNAEEEVDGSDVEEEEDDDVEIDDDSDVASEFENENRLAELDRDLIIESLSAVYQDSTKILSIFSPEALPAILDDIKSATTTTGKRFRLFKARFDVSSQPCGNRNFLMVDLIVQKLAGTAAFENGTWRPDAILYMGNLVLFLSALTNGDDQAIFETLEYMYNNFPGASLMGVINDDEGMNHQFGIGFMKATIELGVSIRTQFFLQTAQRMMDQESFDPDGILSATFFDEENGGIVRGYEEYEGHRRTMEKVTAICNARVEEIRQFFSTDIKRPIDFRRLNKKYPWKDFVSSVIHWTTQRTMELKAHISTQGGVDAVVERLAAISSSPRDLYDNEGQGQSQLSPTGHVVEDPATVPSPVRGIPVQIEETPIKKIVPRTSTGKNKSKSNQINRLKQIKALRDTIEEDPMSPETNQQNSTRSNGAQVEKVTGKPSHGEETHVVQSTQREASERPNAQAVAADYDQPSLTIEDDIQAEERGEVSPPASQASLVPTQQTATILAAVKRQRIASNKENLGKKTRYTDRQAGARVVDWEEEGEELVRSRKHPRNDTAAVGEEEEEADAFETDKRAHKKSRTEARSLPQRSVLTNVNPSASRDTPDSVSDADKDPQPRKSKPPPSTQPAPTMRAPPIPRPDHAPSSQRPPSSAAPPSSQVQQANTQAKVNARRFVEVSQRRPQIRRKWDQDEIDRLMKLIQLYETGWSRIVEEDKLDPEGPMLDGRNQVALKDKARNIKMDYLKACKRLPPGFANVSIKASDMAKLDELGIPHQYGPGGRGIGADEDEDEEE